MKIKLGKIKVGKNKCCTRGNMEFDYMPCAMELEVWYCNVCETEFEVPMSIERFWDEAEEVK